jgi:3-oxoisoapionate kinase
VASAGPAGGLLVSYYGDDFTGSTDALESLSVAGVRTALFMRPPDERGLARRPDLRGVGVAGLTRSMPPGPMEAELVPAFERLKALGAPFVHYKVCSTFDSSPEIGSIGRVIDVASRIFDAPFVPLLVGAPALGRYCIFGNLFASAGADPEPFRLDRHPTMSRHPITPADESDLRVHLSRQTDKRIALFDVLKLSRPAAEARAALEAVLEGGPEVVLFDVLYAEQLGRIGALLAPFASPGRPLFIVGSSGAGAALAAHWAEEGVVAPVEEFPDPGPAGPLLVASGSCSPVTERQIQAALGAGFKEVALDTTALARDDQDETPIRAARAAVVETLSAGCSVVLHTARGGSDPRIGETARVLATRGLEKLAAKTFGARVFGTALGRIARDAVEQCGLRRLGIAGGDTSGFVANALGIEALEMVAPMLPGVPLCRVHAPGSAAHGLEVGFKGGQVGGGDYFSILRRGRP